MQNQSLRWDDEANKIGFGASIQRVRHRIGRRVLTTNADNGIAPYRSHLEN
jgi:hypothetical protein